jgi:hypothetical protein
MGPVVQRIRTLGVLDHSHTGRKGLLELVGLVAVLEDKGVELAAAADLELDLLVGVLLHARSCCKTWKSAKMFIYFSQYIHCLRRFRSNRSYHIPRSSHAVSCSKSSYFSCRVQRTGSILAAADLDEALDVGDFAGHVGGIV